MKKGKDIEVGMVWSGDEHTAFCSFMACSKVREEGAILKIGKKVGKAGVFVRAGGTRRPRLSRGLKRMKGILPAESRGIM